LFDSMKVQLPANIKNRPKKFAPVIGNGLSGNRKLSVGSQTRRGAGGLMGEGGNRRLAAAKLCRADGGEFLSPPGPPLLQRSLAAETR